MSNLKKLLLCLFILLAGCSRGEFVDKAPKDLSEADNRSVAKLLQYLASAAIKSETSNNIIPLLLTLNENSKSSNNSDRYFLSIPLTEPQTKNVQKKFNVYAKSVGISSLNGREVRFLYLNKWDTTPGSIGDLKGLTVTSVTVDAIWDKSISAKSIEEFNAPPSAEYIPGGMLKEDQINKDFKYLGNNNVFKMRESPELSSYADSGDLMARYFESVMLLENSSPGDDGKLVEAYKWLRQNAYKDKMFSKTLDLYKKVLNDQQLKEAESQLKQN